MKSLDRWQALVVQETFEFCGGQLKISITFFLMAHRTRRKSSASAAASAWLQQPSMHPTDSRRQGPVKVSNKNKTKNKKKNRPMRFKKPADQAWVFIFLFLDARVLAEKWAACSAPVVSPKHGRRVTQYVRPTIERHLYLFEVCYGSNLLKKKCVTAVEKGTRRYREVPGGIFSILVWIPFILVPIDIFFYIPLGISHI